MLKYSKHPNATQQNRKSRNLSKPERHSLPHDSTRFHSNPFSSNVASRTLAYVIVTVPSDPQRLSAAHLADPEPWRATMIDPRSSGRASASHSHPELAVSLTGLTRGRPLARSILLAGVRDTPIFASRPPVR